MKQVCAFLDLLGYSNYMNSNFSDAFELIENYTHILHTGIKLDGQYNSFKYVIPFSDSIFIISEKTDDFIEDISRFLLDNFYLTSNEYTHPIDPSEPTKVIIKKARISRDGKFTVNDIEARWYPGIFRGGITFDEVKTFVQIGVNNYSLYDQINLAGRGVVKAVSLEKQGRGPRIFCDHEFIKLLSSEKRKKFIHGNNNITEILWPVAAYIDSNTDYHIELVNGFSKLFYPVLSLWKAYESTPAGIVYFNFLNLIVFSTIKYFTDRNYREDAIRFIKEKLEEEGIGYYFESFTYLL